MKILKKLNSPKKIYFIAEIGINHEGSEKICKKMIFQAKKSGADAAKIQIVDADQSYEKETRSFKEFKKRSLSIKSYLNLIKYAKKIKIDFFATPGDFKSLKLIKKLNFPIIKISSGLMTNSFLLEECFKSGKFLIVSNGIGDENDHKFLKRLIKKYKYGKKISILKCTSQYPSNPENLNLSSIKNLKKNFNVPVGYSDHLLGDNAIMTAITCGAKIIEKHFTLDKKQKGADHKISFLPNEFKLMIKKANFLLKILGENHYFINKSILITRKKMLRYFVSSKEIKKGEKLSYENINFMRIKNHDGAIDTTVKNNKLLGKKLKISVKKNQIIKKKMIDG